MTTRKYVILNEKDKAAFIEDVRRSPTNPHGFVVDVRRAKRTIDQNAKMWAMLGDVASQAEYHGMKLSSDDWKLIFMDSLGHELRMVPNLDNTGFIGLGRSSSNLSKSDMSQLIELIIAYAAQNGIKLKERE